VSITVLEVQDPSDEDDDTSVYENQPLASRKRRRTEKRKIKREKEKRRSKRYLETVELLVAHEVILLTQLEVTALTGDARPMVTLFAMHQHRLFAYEKGK